MARKKWSTALLVTIYAQFAGYVPSCAGDTDAVDHTTASARQDKLLNVFNIIKFPNDGCETVSGTYGVCYTASECDSLGETLLQICHKYFLHQNLLQVGQLQEIVQVVLEFVVYLLVLVEELHLSTTHILRFFPQITIFTI